MGVRPGLGVAKIIRKRNCGGNKKSGLARGFVGPRNKKASVLNRLPNSKQNSPFPTCNFTCSCAMNMSYNSKN